MGRSDRYNTSAFVEAQCESGSRGRVLRNKHGITRKRDMDEAESVTLKVAIDRLLSIYDEKLRLTKDSFYTYGRSGRTADAEFQRYYGQEEKRIFCGNQQRSEQGLQTDGEAL